MGGRNVPRVLSGAGLLVAFAVAAVLMLGSGGPSYELHATVRDAGQLVKGNLVKIGGVTVGEVTAIELDDRNRASLTLSLHEGRFIPLRRGTRASIRGTSLSSVAGRIVTLTPGPENAPEIADGGEIPVEDTDSIVDLDQVLNTLDAETRADLQGAVHGLATSYAADPAAANRGLRALSPAVAQARLLTGELLRDRGAFEDLVVRSAAVVHAVGSRDDDLAQGVAHAARTAGAVAGAAGALDATLRRAPRTLRRANTTLANLRSTLEDVRPALRDLRPAAPRLAAVLRRAEPLTRRAVPIVADVRRTLPDVTDALAELPRLDRIGRPAVASTVDALAGTEDILPALRSYVPDVVGGFLNGFGGTTGASYDANGHYVRIALAGNAATVTGLASLTPLPQGGGGKTPGLDAYRTGLVGRCPGAATQAAPDGSNPFKPDGVDCRLEDTPR